MKLGPYDVLGEVGRGGMGVVLKARAPDGRVVAVKCMLSSVKGDALARFDRERRLLNTLGSDDGFVPLLDYGQSQRGPFIVMPFLSGGTLRDKLRNGPFGLEEGIQLAKDLANALAHAHAQGIVHRDLKPENVLFTDDGKPLVSDLGLAKHWSKDTPGASQSVSLSIAGQARGTAGYMAPEQMDDARSVGPAADVFALGAIIYECLTGEPAFEGDNIGEMFGKVVGGTWVPLRTRRPDVPKRLARVIERTLAPKAENRYPDAGAFARALSGDEKEPSGPGARRALLVLGPLIAIAAAAGVLLPRLRARPTEGGDAPRGGAVVSSANPTSGPAAPALESTRKPVAVWGSLAWRHAAVVTAVAFAPDGKHVVSASEDATVRIWDLASGRVTTTLAGHARPVTGIAFTPQGRIATSSLDGTVRLWDVATEKTVWVATTPDEERAVAVAPDGARIAACDANNHVRTWRASDGTPEWTMEGNGAGSMSAIAFVRGESFLLTANDDGSVRMWDLEFGQPGEVLRGGNGNFGGHVALAVAGEGRIFVSGGVTGDLIIRDKTHEIRRLTGHSGPILAVAISDDARRVVSSSTDGTLRVWDAQRGGELARLEHRESIVACALSFDGRRAVTGGGDGTVRLWDTTTMTPINEIVGHRAAVTGVAVLPNQKRAVTASPDKTLIVWDVASGKPERVLRSRMDHPLDCLALLGSERMVATGSRDGTAQLWDISSEADSEAWVFDGYHRGRVTAVAGSPTADKVLTACVDGHIRYFDSNDRKGLEGGCNWKGAALAISVFRDGSHALVGGEAGTINLLEVHATEAINRGDVGTLTTAVTALAYARDGEHALSGGADGVLTWWDIADRKPAPIGKCDGRVNTITFLRADRFVTTSADATVRVWDAVTHRELERIALADDPPASLAVFSDGRSFLVGTERGLIRRYTLDDK